MGRKLVSISLVIILCFSLVVFFNYSESTRKESATGGKDDARILMENFSYRRYQNEIDELYIASKVGKVMGDGRIVLKGDVQALRKKELGNDIITSESAIAYFLNSSIVGANEDAELDRVDFAINVQIKVNEHLILTEKATYRAQQQLIVSNQAVEIRSKLRSFKSDKGFRYSIQTEDLEMYGSIEGEFEREKDAPK